MNQVTLELGPQPGNSRNSEGAFITLKSGRILFVYSKYITDNSNDEEPSALASRYSDDDGLTWSSEDRFLVSPDEHGHNVMSVSLLRLQNGRIALFYVQKEWLPTGGHRGIPLLRFSDDEMETLSDPIKLTRSLDYHVLNNDRIVQLESGRLIVPVAHHRFTPFPVGEEGLIEEAFNLAAIVFFFISDDNGQTWRESRNSFYRSFPDGTGLQEPGVIELKDGTIWAWARTQWKNGEMRARQWQSFSTDSGELWSEPVPSAFVSACSPLSMKRIPGTGELIAVWNDKSGRFPFPERPDYHDRQPLSAAISNDEGTTWKNHFLLEDDPARGYCYTAIHFMDDAVLFSYCAGGPEPEHSLQRLRIRRVSLDLLRSQ